MHQLVAAVTQHLTISGSVEVWMCYQLGLTTPKGNTLVMQNSEII